MASTKSQWADLQDLLLALNIAAEKHRITYHYVVTSKFNHKTKNWNRIVKITKFVCNDTGYRIVDTCLPLHIEDGIKYATDQLKEIQK